ncbi:hypothetical protein [Martelella alba]|uniref:Oxygen-regulated invasion protein OrgB n=1 Tax=Martelella alba TaxID=2590451 RepID=A0ABY2SF45_9HYPH|nr:hypothetical protein [Martelella alba]TKI02801.1 hypothetical protein FCN80_23890 [Martelella alba]
MIKRTQLRRQRQSLDVLASARRQASRMVKQAQEDAQAIHRQAFSDGYQEGLVASAGVVAEFLAQEQQMAAQLQRQTRQFAQRILSSALDHSEILLDLVEEWLAALPEESGSTGEGLELLAPESARHAHVRLKERIAAVWPGKFSLTYHDDKRFVMKYADQLAEFDADAFVTAATQRLTLTDSLPEDCRRLSAAALAQLNTLFGRFASPNSPDTGKLT